MEFKNLKVAVIDKEKLNVFVDEQIKKEIKKANGSTFAPSLEEGEYFKTRHGKLGVIVNYDELFIIDDECILHTEKIGVYSHVKISESKSTFTVFPKFNITIPAQELIDRFSEETLPIVEFMGDRYNYNYRIETNQFQLAKKLGVKIID